MFRDLGRTSEQSWNLKFRNTAFGGMSNTRGERNECFLMFVVD
jgi:hypothetical protein